MLDKAFQLAIAAAQASKAREPPGPVSNVLSWVTRPWSIQTITNHSDHAHGPIKRDIRLMTALMSFVEEDIKPTSLSSKLLGLAMDN